MLLGMSEDADNWKDFGTAARDLVAKLRVTGGRNSGASCSSRCRGREADAMQASGGQAQASRLNVDAAAPGRQGERTAPIADGYAAGDDALRNGLLSGSVGGPSAKAMGCAGVKEEPPAQRRSPRVAIEIDAENEFEIATDGVVIGGRVVQAARRETPHAAWTASPFGSSDAPQGDMG